MKDAVIVSAARTPIGKAIKGSFTKVRPDDMFEKAITAVLGRVPKFDYELIDDIIAGAAFPEAEEGMNIARVAGILAKLPIDVPGVTVSRFCGSAMSALHIGANAIMAGNGDVFIVGGTETMSLIPMGGGKPAPNLRITGKNEEGFNNVYIGMGETAENVVTRFKDKYGKELSRENLDKFAYESHMKAVAAIKAGRFDDEVVPLAVSPVGEVMIVDKKTKKVPEGWKLVDKDEGPRGDTTLEALAKLKPVFKAGGVVTAGNSSPLNDGASAMLIMSAELAAKLKIKPLAKIRGMAVRGLEPEIMGMGPVISSQLALKRAGLKVKDIELWEINEAFATQSIVSILELGMDPTIVNVNGGAIALGHPLAESGTRILTTLLYEMTKRNLKLGVGTMCVGGGQGTATVIERL